MDDRPERKNLKVLTRSRFLVSLYLTELALVVLSVIITSLTDHTLFPFGFTVSAESLLLGVLSAAPIALLVLVASIGPVSRLVWVKRAMTSITGRLQNMLGSTMLSLTAVDIVLLSATAGFAEEMFFRGLLQSYIGIIGSAVVFGLLHALTPAYFVMATGIGLYFGFLYETSGNLLIPMVGHAVYDVFALYLLRWEFTRH
jgi:membrane protease YdiL (CAAX protease family)